MCFSGLNDKYLPGIGQDNFVYAQNYSRDSLEPAWDIRPGLSYLTLVNRGSSIDNTTLSVLYWDCQLTYLCSIRIGLKLWWCNVEHIHNSYSLGRQQNLRIDTLFWESWEFITRESEEQIKASLRKCIISLTPGTIESGDEAFEIVLRTFSQCMQKPYVSHRRTSLHHKLPIPWPGYISWR